MKTFISIISLACLCLIPTQAQTVDKEALYIYQTDGKANIFFRSEVTAISLEMKNGVIHQVVYTGNKKHYFAISKIQSTSFVNPDEETYRPEISSEEDGPTFGKVIDLGLPSGTKWASCNVGAHSPEQYGGYYAWGETEEKNYYGWNTYNLCDGNRDVCYNIGSDISGTEYDVAHVKWGGKWCMPTIDNISELIDNCETSRMILNGVYGMKFISKLNGNSIFLPATGDRWDGKLDNAGGFGYYWSSTQNPDYSNNAYDFFYFNSGCAYWGSDYRCNGHSVRPVVRN